MSERKVSRVLVMLEYGEGDPDNGEVFDLTALVSELRTRKDIYNANLSMQVTATKLYGYDGGNTGEKEKLEVSWGGSFGGEWVHGASHLTDVINSGLPDGERVIDLKAKAKRLRKKAEQIDYEARVAKLQQAAAVRSQHPIARVTQTALALPGMPTPQQEDQQ